ncbi:MAG TPA: type II secretion system protein GspL [Geobacteraceae bacterium]|nr:type II secretion system protein GspL [Geobacteraceae bacterium]
MFITVIQISADELIFARFSRQRSHLLFLEGVRHRLDETDLAELLAPWKEKSGGDRIILSLPAALFSIREIELPIGERKKAREILPLELRGETALESDEIIFDILPLKPGTYAALWCSATRLAPHIARLASAGLDPEIVTSPLFTWQHLLPAGDSAHCVLTDGEAAGIYKDGNPVYLRALPAAGDKPLDATLAAVELAKGITVDQIFTLAGSERENLLPDAAPLPISSSLAACFPADTGAARDLASAYAAAADLIGGDPVNFRRGPLTFVRRKLELQRKLRLTAALAAAVLLLLFAETGVRYYLLQKDLTSVESSIRKIYGEVFPKRSRAVDEVAELKAEIKRLGTSSSQGVLAPLKKLSEAKGEELSELYEIDIEGSQVSGKGVARTLQGVNDFKTRCTPLFGGFEVSEIKSRPDGATGFSFRSGSKEVGK